MWSNTISVLKRSAWARKRCISSGPCTPSTSAGQIVDFGGGHELAALGDAGDQHRAEVGAGGVMAAV